MTSNTTNNSDSVIVVDIDGTLCPIKPEGASYADLEPYADMVSRLREYRALGFRIALNTSRNMRSFNGNIGRINAVTAPQLVDWLRRWDIPYDELYFGKPWPGERGFYVDDRAVRPNEFLTMSHEQIEALVDQSRCVGGAPLS